MMTETEIKEVARLMGLRPYQTEKRYIQALILRSLYSRTNNELIFKGGTAVFFAYGLKRFSEDLDFTENRELDYDRLIKSVIEDLSRSGVNSTVKRMSDNQTGVSFRIGSEGPLFEKEIGRCYVAIDISKRERPILPPVSMEIDTGYVEVPAINLLVMDKKEIMAEKVRAIITRNKARDLYDLWFLLKMSEPCDIKLIESKLQHYKVAFDYKKFIESVERRSESWQRELSPLIIGGLDPFNAVLKDVKERTSVWRHYGT